MDLPEGLDLAELRHRAEVAEAAAALMAEQRDNALLRVETAERELASANKHLGDALKARDEFLADKRRLQADLTRAVEALGPFVRLTRGYLTAEFAGAPDDMITAIGLPIGHFRRASEVFTSLSEKGEGNG